MKPIWDRLIRFEAADGRILRGEPILPSPTFDLGLLTDEDKLEAKIIVGNDIFDQAGATKLTNEIVRVKKILGPLEQGEVPILRCVGLNYAKHSMFPRDFVQCCPADASSFSQRSRQISTTIPIHILQAQHVCLGSWSQRRDPKDCPGRPGRLRRGTSQYNLSGMNLAPADSHTVYCRWERCKGRCSRRRTGLRRSVYCWKRHFFQETST